MLKSGWTGSTELQISYEYSRSAVRIIKTSFNNGSLKQIHHLPPHLPVGDLQHRFLRTTTRVYSSHSVAMYIFVNQLLLLAKSMTLPPSSPKSTTPETTIRSTRPYTTCFCRVVWKSCGLVFPLCCVDVFRHCQRIGTCRLGN